MQNIAVYQATPTDDHREPASAAMAEVVDLVDNLKYLGRSSKPRVVATSRAAGAPDTEDVWYGWSKDGKTAIVAINRETGAYAIDWGAGRPGRPTTIADRVELRISVPAELRRRLREACSQSGESEAAIVRAALASELERRKS